MFQLKTIGHLYSTSRVTSGTEAGGHGWPPVKGMIE